MSAAYLMALLLAGPPTVAGPPLTATEQARGLTRRSIFEYNTGEYVKALADIERAYELDSRPALLFNVGQCQRALGHHREAAAAFKSYLRDSPNAPNRERAAGLAAEMEKLARQDEKNRPAQPPQPRNDAAVVVVAAAPAELSPALEAAVTVTEPSRHIRVGAWWLGGAGLAVAVAGTVLFAVCESTMSGDHPVSLGGGVTEHQLTSAAFNTAATEGYVGEGLWAGGGALLVSGVIVALTGGSR
jgi:tetratricopeptide (TPR) repeat protein